MTSRGARCPVLCRIHRLLFAAPVLGLVLWGGTRGANAAGPPAGTTAPPAAAPSTQIASPDDERPISDPPREPTPAAVLRARELYNEGNKLAQQGDLAGAFRAFRGSYEHDGGVEALANMAAVEQALGRPRAAAEHLDAALARLPASKADKKGALKERLAEISKEITVVKLHITAEGSQVYVDDRGLGAGPMERAVYLDLGTHMVLVRVPGAVIRREVFAVKGATVDVTVDEEDARRYAAIQSGVPAPSSPPSLDGPSISSRAWFLAGVSVALTVPGVVGLGMMLRSHDAQTTLDQQIERLGGRCGQAPSAELVVPCLARDQEASNKTIGAVIGSVGAAGLTGAWLGYLFVTLAERSEPEVTSRVRVIPMLGGAMIQGSF